MSAIVVYFVGAFSGKFFLNMVLAAVMPTIKAIAAFIFGASIVNFLGGLIDWYGDNQLKFNFWVFYVAAVCDDLGIPNLKTLARFLWRRYRNRNQTVPSEPMVPVAQLSRHGDTSQASAHILPEPNPKSDELPVSEGSKQARPPIASCQ